MTNLEKFGNLVLNNVWTAVKNNYMDEVGNV